MRQILKEAQPFEKSEISADEARTVFADHKYKLEIIDDASTDPMSATSAKGEVRCYENVPPEPRPNQTFHGHDGFIDLCRGPHVPTTSDHLGHFKLLRVAGAYWKGDEKNPQLQRIYGTAWATKAELAEHLERLEQAAARDHRKLGVELDLFSFPDEIGSGLAVFHPKGGIVRREMEDYSRRRHEEADYEFVYSPHITKQGPVRDLGAPPVVRRRHVPAHALRRRGRPRGHQLLPQADELPVPLLDLPGPAAQLPRAAASGCSSSGRSTATRSPAWSTASPGCGA